jgi:hypothetical protein
MDFSRAFKDAFQPRPYEGVPEIFDLSWRT